MSEPNEQLDPCPFCGSPATISEGLNISDGDWIVDCTECSAFVPYNDSEAEAVAAWNRRATPAPQAAPSGWQDALLAEMHRAFDIRQEQGRDADGAMAFDDTQIGVEFAMAWVEKNFLAPPALAITQAAPSEPVATLRYVMMPARLTAENGAKGALSGEFKESVTVTCYECGGSGEHVDGVDAANCPECNGNGTVEQDVPVTWDTIKAIYKAAVALLAAPVAAPQAQADVSQANAKDAEPEFTHDDVLDLRYAADVLRMTGHHATADGIFNIAARIAAATQSKGER